MVTKLFILTILTLTGLLPVLQATLGQHYDWKCGRQHNHQKKPIVHECHKYDECKWISEFRSRMEQMQCHHRMIFDETVGQCVPPKAVSKKSRCYVPPVKVQQKSKATHKRKSRSTSKDSKSHLPVKNQNKSLHLHSAPNSTIKGHGRSVELHPLLKGQNNSISGQNKSHPLNKTHNDNVNLTTKGHNSSVPFKSQNNSISFQNKTANLEPHLLKKGQNNSAPAHPNKIEKGRSISSANHSKKLLPSSIKKGRIISVTPHPRIKGKERSTHLHSEPQKANLSHSAQTASKKGRADSVESHPRIKNQTKSAHPSIIHSKPHPQPVSILHKNYSNPKGRSINRNAGHTADLERSMFHFPLVRAYNKTYIDQIRSMLNLSHSSPNLERFVIKNNTIKPKLETLTISTPKKLNELGNSTTTSKPVEIFLTMSENPMSMGRSMLDISMNATQTEKPLESFKNQTEKIFKPQTSTISSLEMPNRLTFNFSTTSKPHREILTTSQKPLVIGRSILQISDDNNKTSEKPTEKSTIQSQPDSNHKINITLEVSTIPSLKKLNKLKENDTFDLSTPRSGNTKINERKTSSENPLIMGRSILQIVEDNKTSDKPTEKSTTQYPSVNMNQTILKNEPKNFRSTTTSTVQFPETKNSSLIPSIQNKTLEKSIETSTKTSVVKNILTPKPEKEILRTSENPLIMARSMFEISEDNKTLQNSTTEIKNSEISNSTVESVQKLKELIEVSTKVPAATIFVTSTAKPKMESTSKPTTQPNKNEKLTETLSTTINTTEKTVFYLKPEIHTIENATTNTNNLKSSDKSNFSSVGRSMQKQKEELQNQIEKPILNQTLISSTEKPIKNQMTTESTRNASEIVVLTIMSTEKSKETHLKNHNSTTQQPTMINSTTQKPGINFKPPTSTQNPRILKTTSQKPINIPSSYSTQKPILIDKTTEQANLPLGRSIPSEFNNDTKTTTTENIKAQHTIVEGTTQSSKGQKSTVSPSTQKPEIKPTLTTSTIPHVANRTLHTSTEKAVKVLHITTEQPQTPLGRSMQRGNDNHASTTEKLKDNQITNITTEKPKAILILKTSTEKLQHTTAVEMLTTQKPKNNLALTSTQKPLPIVTTEQPKPPMGRSMEQEINNHSLTSPTTTEKPNEKPMLQKTTEKITIGQISTQKPIINQILLAVTQNPTLNLKFSTSTEIKHLNIMATSTQKPVVNMTTEQPKTTLGRSMQGGNLTSEKPKDNQITESPRHRTTLLTSTKKSHLNLLTSTQNPKIKIVLPASTQKPYVNLTLATSTQKPIVNPAFSTSTQKPIANQTLEKTTETPSHNLTNTLTSVKPLLI